MKINILLRKPLSMEENPLNILYSGVKNKNIIENKDGAIEKWTFVSSLFFDLVVKLK